MRERLVTFIGSGCGVGYLPVAPGTAGTLVGVGYWWLLARADTWVYWLVFVVGVVFAVWCCGAAAEVLRQPDPRCVVLDEISVMPLALAGLGMHPWKIIVGFIWFRVFDVWKPPPVRQAEMFSGGVGIVLDDLIAAAYACGVTHLVVWIVGLVT